MRNSKLYKLINRIGKILLISICLFFLLRYFYFENKFKHNYRYTIGKVVNVEKVRLHYSVYYKIRIKGECLVNWDSKKEFSKDKIGNWYWVKYYPEKPDGISELLDILVKDTLINIPEEGLDHLPK